MNSKELGNGQMASEVTVIFDPSPGALLQLLFPAQLSGAMATLLSSRVHGIHSLRLVPFGKTLDR